MSFLEKVSSIIPIGKKEEVLEYFFALNIESENLTAALWTIDKKELKILEVASAEYKLNQDIVNIADKLLDAVLGVREIEVKKILFGVPDGWLHQDNLKEEYLKLLRGLVKEFGLEPMAYVASSHALIHMLEKKDEVPTTAIVVGVEDAHIAVTVVRAGKLDGTKIVERGERLGTDIEKGLLTFTAVETLPSKVLLYGKDKEKLDKEKTALLSYPWMSKLSFLHLPKIEILGNDLAISSICLAGASELAGDVSFKFSAAQTVHSVAAKHDLKEPEIKEIDEVVDKTEKKEADQEDFGFVVGDVSKQIDEEREKVSLGEEETPLDEDLAVEETINIDDQSAVEESNIALPTRHAENALQDFEKRFKLPVPSFTPSLKKFLPAKNIKNLAILMVVLTGLIVLVGLYLFLPKATVRVFVEPRILEKDTQVIADPKQKEVDEEAKVIPAQTVETEVSGSDKESATGRKQVGDAAKGVVKIINNSSQLQTLAKGSAITGPSGLKFTLDTAVNIASTSATSESKSTATVNVTASSIGADSNLASGTQFTLPGSASVAIVAEGNFSGGTSKDVTVVSSDDQKRLLAKVASTLRAQAQQKLQDKLPEKKIIQEALSEEITKRSYSKNINDQASDFSLNLTAKYKGTAFDEKDLRTIVAKLVTTQVPEGFQLNIADTETQSDLSKLEKDGRLIFLARFKAKMMPKIDTEEIKNKIKGKTPDGAIETLKQMAHVLDAEVIFTPELPKILQRLPLLGSNISVEVGLK